MTPKTQNPNITQNE